MKISWVLVDILRLNGFSNAIFLPGLAPKLRQIASNRKTKTKKKRKKHNEIGCLECCLRFDLMSIVYAPKAKVYWGQTLFFNFTFFLITSKLLVIEQRICHHHAPLADTNRVMPTFARKAHFKIWPPTQPGVTGQLRLKMVVLGIIWFWAMRKTLWYQFNSLITFVSNSYGQKSSFPQE